MVIKESKLSFEVFPANTEIGAHQLLETVTDLAKLSPDFISVTCSNNKQSGDESTIQVAQYIKQVLQVETIVHLPAVYLSKNQVEAIIKSLDNLNIHQILALRGDIYSTLQSKDDFHYASELIHFIREKAPHFKISGACYPEVHPEAKNRVSDVKFLKHKCDLGCDQLITQLFFDNDLFYHFEENCELAGIEVPILAGIMPIVNRSQAIRLIKTTKTKLPRKFLAIIEKYEHDPLALREAGLAYAIDQIVDLVTQDVSGIHLYTMNSANVAQHIYQQTASLFRTSKLTVN